MVDAKLQKAWSISGSRYNGLYRKLHSQHRDRCFTSYLHNKHRSRLQHAIMIRFWSDEKSKQPPFLSFLDCMREYCLRHVFKILPGSRRRSADRPYCPDQQASSATKETSENMQKQHDDVSGKTRHEWIEIVVAMFVAQAYITKGNLKNGNNKG